MGGRPEGRSDILHRMRCTWIGAGVVALVACGSPFAANQAPAGADASADAIADQSARESGPAADAATSGDARADAGPKDAGAPDSPVVGDGSPPPVEAGAPRAVFVTSTAYTADELNGLVAADGTCQSRAGTAGLKGTYKAWLSTDSLSAEARMTHSTGPYRLLNGTTIASNWQELTSGTLKAPIDETETMGAPPKLGATVCGELSSSPVWTGTNADGTSGSGTECNTWGAGMLAATSALVGSANATDGTWSAWCAASCLVVAALYCVEQ
jgi:hypothetical protein